MKDEWVYHNVPWKLKEINSIVLIFYHEHNYHYMHMLNVRHC